MDVKIRGTIDERSGTFSLLQNAKTDYEAHPTSQSMGTSGPFARRKWPRNKVHVPPASSAEVKNESCKSIPFSWRTQVKLHVLFQTFPRLRPFPSTLRIILRQDTIITKIHSNNSLKHTGVHFSLGS